MNYSLIALFNILTRYQGEWLAEGVETGTKFTGIELEEGEWFEYDEKSNEEVSINDIKWEVRRS